jgi:sec-independent protein translocase protein TatA
MNLATFGNFLGPDTLIIFLIILIFFGAKRLPELARGLGQAIREFSKAKDDFSNELTRSPELPPQSAPGTAGKLPSETAYGEPKVEVTPDPKGKVMSEAATTRHD